MQPHSDILLPQPFAPQVFTALIIAAEYSSALGRIAGPEPDSTST